MSQDFSRLAEAVCLDVETTGLDSDCDRIVSLAMLKTNFSALRKTNTLEFEVKKFLFHPEQMIPPDATSIHGIRDEDVYNEPKFAERAEEIRDLLGNLPIVGHNIKFDIDFLNMEFRRSGLKPLVRNETFCTMLKYQEDVLDGRRRGSRLIDAARYFGIEHNNFHDAQFDAFVAGQIAGNFWKRDKKDKLHRNIIALIAIGLLIFFIIEMSS